MDIKEIEFSPFASSLMKLEKEAEDPAARRRAERYTGCVALFAFIGALAVGMPVAILLCAWIGLTSFASLLFTSLVISGLPVAYLAARYSDEAQWRLRTAGPQSRAFLEANGARRAALMEASGGYNATLGGLMALPSGEDPEAGATLAASMEQRRAALARETDAYLRAFEAATAADRARYAAPPVRKRKLNPRKAALREFKRKVRQLEELETALGRLQSAADAGVTVDLTPFVAAQRYRQDLEEERAALVSRGLKPRQIPAPRAASRKLLPAAV